MKSPFASGPPPLVGLDVNTASATLVVLGRSGRGFRVEAFGTAPMPPGAMADQNVASVELVGQAIAEAVRRSGTMRKHAALAVPGSLVISRRIPMPANLDERDLELQVNLDADQHIPFPLDEVYLDFHTLGPNLKSPESVDVLLAAARREVVDLRVDGAEAGGLTANVVDVEAYALESSYTLIAPHLAPELQRGVVALVDIGPDTTTLNVLRDGRSTFTREQTFGVEQLTAQIEQRLGLPREQALEAPRRGALDAAFVAEVLEPFRDSVASQTVRLLQAYFSISGDTRLDAVLLSGPGANLPGIAASVQELVEVPTTRADPIAGLELARGLPTERMRQESPALMLALGLALRTFDDAAR